MTAPIEPYYWLAAILRGEARSFSDLEIGTTPDDIWQVAEENGVTTLLGDVLANSAVWNELPRELKQRLRDHVRESAARELLSERETIRALREISNAGISCLMLKGTPLAYSLYPKPYLRTRCDTDLLFASRDEAEKAFVALEKLGYTRPLAVSGEFVSYEFSCSKTTMNVDHTLDMHWRLSNTQQFAHAFSYPELEESAIGVNALENFRALDPVHALLLACMHRISHKPWSMENRLIWLFDIHLLCTRFTPVQWQEFHRLAIEKHIAHACLDGLNQTRTAFHTAVPGNVLSGLLQGSEDEPLDAVMGTSRLSMELANLRSLPSWKARLQMLKEHLLPDSNYMLKKYDTDRRYLLPYLYLRRSIEGIIKLLR